MPYGICTSPDTAPHFAKAGFDFLELNVQTLLKGEADDDAFQAELGSLRHCPLPVHAANCYVPGSMKITGPDADPKRLSRYAANVFRRAQIVGIKTIVFGSGDARKVPYGFSRTTAWQQLLEFIRISGDFASRHDVTLVVEPLNAKECNILTSVGECARFVRETSHPSIRLLVDSYHWWLDDNDEEALVSAGDLLHHVHVATRKNRLAPGEEPDDFPGFLAILREANYRGPISIEAAWADPAICASRALEILSTR